MKATVIISGQISGNFTLKHAVQTFDCEVEKYFNGFMLHFNTMAEARKAMKQAYKELKEEEPDFYKDGGIQLYNDVLSYDASTASLHKKNEI